MFSVPEKLTTRSSTKSLKVHVFFYVHLVCVHAGVHACVHAACLCTYCLYNVYVCMCACCVSVCMHAHVHVYLFLMVSLCIPDLLAACSEANGHSWSVSGRITAQEQNVNITSSGCVTIATCPYRLLPLLLHVKSKVVSELRV